MLGNVSSHKDLNIFFPRSMISPEKANKKYEPTLNETLHPVKTFFDVLLAHGRLKALSWTITCTKVPTLQSILQCIVLLNSDGILWYFVTKEPNLPHLIQYKTTLFLLWSSSCNFPPFIWYIKLHLPTLWAHCDQKTNPRLHSSTVLSLCAACLVPSGEHLF